LIGIAGLYFWLDYQFIAAVQIVVYVGGIVGTDHFSIFLTQQAGEKLAKQKIGRKYFQHWLPFAALLLDNRFKYTSIHFMNIRKNLSQSMFSNIGKKMLSVNTEGYALTF
jgi:NADH-quinone oxidoreductase subunit J